jgi:hypothetical protein
MHIPIWFIENTEREFPVVIIVVRSRVFRLGRLPGFLSTVAKRTNKPLCARLPDQPPGNKVSHRRLRKTVRMALCRRSNYGKNITS